MAAISVTLEMAWIPADRLNCENAVWKLTLAFALLCVPYLADLLTLLESEPR